MQVSSQHLKYVCKKAEKKDHLDKASSMLCCCHSFVSGGAYREITSVQNCIHPELHCKLILRLAAEG